jgi:hypothetical protein
MGRFFDDVFLPMMKRLVEAGLSYDDVKRLVKIPTTWGAKISDSQFRPPRGQTWAIGPFRGPSPPNCPTIQI